MSDVPEPAPPEQFPTDPPVGESLSDKRIRLISTAQKYQTISCPIDILLKSEKNPNNEIDPEELEALKESVKNDPDYFRMRPVLANAHPGREGRVLAGDKRLRAAHALGMTHVPTMFVIAQTMEREKEILLKDNHHNGKIDEKIKAELLKELRDSGYNMAGLGFTPMALTSSIQGLATDPADPASADEGGHSTTPGAAYMQCPECGFAGGKKEFPKLTKDEFETVQASPKPPVPGSNLDTGPVTTEEGFH